MRDAPRINANPYLKRLRRCQDFFFSHKKHKKTGSKNPAKLPYNTTVKIPLWRGELPLAAKGKHRTGRETRKQTPHRIRDEPACHRKGKSSNRDTPRTRICAGVKTQQRKSTKAPALTARKPPHQRRHKSASYTAMSRFGETPKCLLYSRLNCVGLSYPTAYAAFATVSLSEIIRRRASCNRRFFWY